MANGLEDSGIAFPDKKFIPAFSLRIVYLNSKNHKACYLVLLILGF